MYKFFENLIDPYADGPSSNAPPNKLVPFLLDYLRPFRFLLAINLTISFLVSIFEVAMIYYLGRLVDIATAASPDTFWAEHKVELIIVLALVLVLRPLLKFVQSALSKNAIQPNVAALGRWRSHSHVLQQPVGWFESDFAGRIANRVVQLSAATGELVFRATDGLAFVVSFIIGAGVMLAYADARLLIPLVIWVVAYGFYMRMALRYVRKAARASSAARSKTLGFVVDSYSNIQSVKLFSHNERELDHAKEILENHRHTYMKENRIITNMNTGLAALNGFLIFGIIGWSLYLWTDNVASVGLIASAGAIALRINSMSGWFMETFSGVLQALGVISEGMETVTQPIGLTDRVNAGQLTVDKGAIELKTVVHHYGRDSGGLHGISTIIAPAEKVGIVGRSGAGKSTLVKALLRLYDAESGQILIDDTDIASVTQASLRAHIGMVQQESSLLHRSIMDNMLYGRPDATREEVIKATKQAEAHDFILDLEDTFGNKGYDAQVGERGVKLSGGQRQRVALARVILKDAPILIMDEATSALDSEVEAQIQQTLYKMMEGKTVIAIAHRLSTIAQMDRIIVLDEGQIFEDGSHDELIAKNGLYTNLWNRQSGGFIAQ